MTPDQDNAHVQNSLHDWSVLFEDQTKWSSYWMSLRTATALNFSKTDLFGIQIPTVPFLLSAFLWNFFLCQDHWHGDVPPHLAQPCCVALGWALIRGLCPDLCEGSVSPTLLRVRTLYLCLVHGYLQTVLNSQCVSFIWENNTKDLRVQFNAKQSSTTKFRSFRNIYCQCGNKAQ